MHPETALTGDQRPRSQRLQTIDALCPITFQTIMVGNTRV